MRPVEGGFFFPIGVCLGKELLLGVSGVLGGRLPPQAPRLQDFRTSASGKRLVY